MLRRARKLTVLLFQVDIVNRTEFVDMSNYMQSDEGMNIGPQEYKCGTSCCFIGYAPIAFEGNRSFKKSPP